MPDPHPSARLAKLIEANVIAVHAYQIALARKLGKGDPNCYGSKLSDTDLESIVSHQGNLLASDTTVMTAWAKGQKSTFDPSQDLDPILSSSLTIPENAPVNTFTTYLRKQSNVPSAHVRAIANLYQTILEVERDGDRLQEEYDFFIALNLPVTLRQLDLPGNDALFLEAGTSLSAQTCVSPFDTDAAAWQIAGRKIWNWGDKKLHMRDEQVLAREISQEADLKAVIAKIHALPAQKIAIIGHSFTMGAHWSSPSSFVPIVSSIFGKRNPQVEFKQFAAGGLTASRAYKNFFSEVRSWKPDKILLVILTRTDEDFAALRQLAEGFSNEETKLYMFDNLLDPDEKDRALKNRQLEVALASGITVIEVGEILASSPQRDQFLCLDGIHMTEPYHRLMAKEWLKFLVGAREAKMGR